jgi:ribosomal protein S18 acetylase RimI-like enzyme
VEFATLDHTDHAQSERISEVLLDSYAVEAELIGVDDFAPLRRRCGDIREAGSTFYGCVGEGRLVGVAEVERDGGGAANIAGFAVHPSVFRRGVGSRLLQHVLEAVDATSFTVSTASANAPAIALYEKHGFRIRDRWAIDGIAMVTLEARG